MVPLQERDPLLRDLRQGGNQCGAGLSNDRQKRLGPGTIQTMKVLCFGIIPMHRFECLIFYFQETEDAFPDIPDIVRPSQQERPKDSCAC